jgi:hypothetical protein
LIDCHVHLVFSASQYALGDVLAEGDQQLLLRSVAAARRALRVGSPPCATWAAEAA